MEAAVLHSELSPLVVERVDCRLDALQSPGCRVKSSAEPSSAPLNPRATQWNGARGALNHSVPALLLCKQFALHQHVLWQLQLVTRDNSFLCLDHMMNLVS